MLRTLIDRSMRSWEVYATTARGGLPTPGRIVFRPLGSAPDRARVATIDGDLARAEATVASVSEAELEDLLDSASPLR